MSLFIAWPWLAALPAVAFLALNGVAPRRILLVAGLAWGAYALWEYGMQRRWLCSGECNIRVDLLLIYPALALISVAAVVGALRGRRGSRARSDFVP